MVIAEFNQETGILDTRFEGSITTQQLVNYIDATKENTSYPRTLKILTDATKADMIFHHQELELIVEANFKSLERYDCIIDAIVIDAPKEMALSMLYKELSKTNKYKFQVFSTREAAIAWLEKQ